MGEVRWTATRTSFRPLHSGVALHATPHLCAGLHALTLLEPTASLANPRLTLTLARPMFPQTSRGMPSTSPRQLLEKSGSMASEVQNPFQTRLHGPFRVCFQPFPRLSSTRRAPARLPRSREPTRRTALQNAGGGSRGTSHRATSLQDLVVGPAPF